MRTLQRELGRFLGAGRKREPDLDRSPRAKFKRLAAREGWQWSKSHDGYIEIDATVAWPRGLSFAFRNWPEALATVEACLADPALVVDGYYSE
jgi:hypothetical protein